MAQWVLDHQSPARLGGSQSRVRQPHGTQTISLPRIPWRSTRNVLYLPITTPDRKLGVLEITGQPGAEAFDNADTAVLESFATQATLALERARLIDEAAQAAVLAQSDELKSALLAAVSHELRTPLATIKASITSLLDPTVAWDDDSRDEFLHAIDEETDRLTRMVTNLLDLSRIEAGVLRPDREWYDVAELVTDVIGRLTPISGRHRLRAEVQPGLPLAHFDYVEMSQVLMNLGENAIHYTPPGTEVTIAASAAAGAIEVVVHDTGAGIAPDQLPHVFERFYRGNQGNHPQGTGIGLTVARGLVEAHGGRIWVESESGLGTAFHFTIPVATATVTAA